MYETLQVDVTCFSIFSSQSKVTPKILIDSSQGITLFPIVKFTEFN